MPTNGSSCQCPDCECSYGNALVCDCFGPTWSCDPVFQCNNGEYVPADYQCDEFADCADGSDELDCTVECNPSTQFTCANEDCIPIASACNGVSNCLDGSDEVGCAACEATQFDCGDECIPDAWVCDLFADCTNSSDEPADCSGNTCEPTEFRCDSGHCIDASWECDDFADCPDDSDEVGCP